MFLSRTCCVLVVFTLLLSFHTTRGQGGQPGNQQGGQQQPPQILPKIGPCAQAFQQDQKNCFGPNGVDLNGTIWVFSGNATGGLPPQYANDFWGFYQLLCSEEKVDLIEPCMMKLFQKHNQSTCEASDRAAMASLVNQFEITYRSSCAPACMTSSTQTLVQCFAAVQISPIVLFNETLSILHSRIDLFGKNATEATAFCNARQKLFSCLSPIASSCPKLFQSSYASGIDYQALEKAAELLCRDVDEYLAARECRAKASISQCLDQNNPKLRDVVTKRFIFGEVKPSAFQKELCKVKLSQHGCEQPVIASSCDKKRASLLKTFECTALPKPCRESTAYQSACGSSAQQGVSTYRPTQSNDLQNPITEDPALVGGVGGRQRGNGASASGPGVLLLSLMAILAVAVVTAAV